MATNKRKDAAALFELIDKSTLKVPKGGGGGSLKIPSWWSSKSNDPSEEGKGEEVPVLTEPLAKVAGGVMQQEPGQQRLFEPPATGVEAGQSPSIRPPMVEVPQVEPTDVPERGEEKEGREDSEIAASDSPPPPTQPAVRVPLSAEPGEQRESYAGLGGGRRVFAPQTMSQGGGGETRGTWSGVGGGRFNLARAPGWLLAAGVGAVVLVLGVLMWAILPPHGGGHGKSISS
ncbi:MAG: hypothetical protein FWD61_10215, partial [Phycisphaerales bacterium]|nr:hypothetical protein [Phycisphaerales bacterium]